MSSSSKFAEDFNKGKNRREMIASYINQYLPEELELKRIHSHLRTMHISQKVKNNLTKNRIFSAPFQKAMGLDYWLTKRDVKTVIPIRFIIINHGRGNVYLKLPSDWIENWEEYLTLLEKLDYHIMIIDTDGPLFKEPIPISFFMKEWTPKRTTSKGNKNRLDFQGPLKELKDTIHPMNYVNLFGGSIVKSMTNLFQ